MKAAAKLFAELIRLPMPARRAIAGALADIAQELMTAEAPRTSRDQELDRLAELEHELRDLPPNDRVDAILQRMPSIGSRSAYYRKRRALRSPTNPT